MDPLTPLLKLTCDILEDVLDSYKENYSPTGPSNCHQIFKDVKSLFSIVQKLESEVVTGAFWSTSARVRKNISKVLNECTQLAKLLQTRIEARILGEDASVSRDIQTHCAEIAFFLRAYGRTRDEPAIVAEFPERLELDNLRHLYDESQSTIETLNAMIDQRNDRLREALYDSSPIEHLELAKDTDVSAAQTSIFDTKYEDLEGRKGNAPNDASSYMSSQAGDTSLYATNTLEDARSQSGDAETPSSAPPLERLKLPAVSTFPTLPQSPDSDEESTASFRFSEKSQDTIASSTTFSKDADEVTAADMFFHFMAFDDLLRPFFEEAPERSTLSAEVFEQKMRRLLKKFARELRSEAESGIQRKAISFLSQRARFVARDLTSHYYWQDEASKLDLGQRNAHRAGVVALENNPGDGEDDTEGEDNDISHAQQADHDFHVLFSPVKDFMLSSAAFAKFRETLRRLLRPELPSWTDIRNQWASEVHSDLPIDLEVDCPVEILIQDKITWADRFKSALEAYTGEEWLWEPFTAPRRPIPAGKVRLQWRCSCDLIQWEDVSHDLARKVQTMQQVRSGLTNRPQAALPSGQSCQSVSSATGVGSTGAVTVTGSDPLASNQGNIDIVGGPNTAASLSMNPASSSQYSSRVLFVLLCVPRGWFGIPELKSTVIEVPESQDDDAFFCEFRKQYISLRGFLHHWFDPWQFSFCHASRFEKWDVDSLGWFCDELPDHNAYEYVPRPPPSPYKILLTEREWKHRFCHPAKTPGLQSAFLKIPKRNYPFQISTDASREYVWGLNAQLRRSGPMVLLWAGLILFLITLGGWVFMTRWLSHYPRDLQDAVAPVTLIMMICGLVCLPLSWLSTSR